MAYKFVFRLDDIAPNMHWDNYRKLKEIFSRHGVKPLIGVIPENRDPELLAFPGKPEADFWDEVRRVQRMGWEVAVHGYQHLYVTEESGLMGLNDRSEFAGLSCEEQLAKLERATAIFKANNITYEAFMAPSHSFDIDTLRALQAVGIEVVTDGYGFRPYRKHGVLLVPQLFATPKKMPTGIYTFCLHLNTMTDVGINRIDRFLTANSASAITFTEAIGHEQSGPVADMNHFVMKHAFKGMRSLKNRRPSQPVTGTPGTDG